MKKQCYLMAIIILALATTGWCNDKTIYSASAITVDGIMGYYSSMSKLETKLKNFQSSMDEVNYNDICDYMDQNREELIIQIAETNSFNNLGLAVQIINSRYRSQGTGHAYDSLKSRATAQGYFDSRTGHRYYKTGKNTYAEYTKTGNFFKTVLSDLPLLTKSQYVHPITETNYILYQKTIQGKNDYLALPVSKQHPKGWKANKALISLK